MITKKRHASLAVAGMASALLATGITVASPATPASAAGSYVWSSTGWTAFRPCPHVDNNFCKPFWYFRNGAAVSMFCWQDGELATGNYASRRWFYVFDPSSGYDGWVHSSLVYNQTSVRQC